MLSRDDTRPRRRSLASTAVALALGASAAFAQSPDASRPCVGRSSATARLTPRVVPRDEGPQRPDFVAFRSMLLQAVRRRDVDAVLGVVDPRIRVSFDGAAGPEAFKEYHVNNPEEDFWAHFVAILNMGGRFRTPDDFDAPYVFSDWPDGLDGFECLAVTGRGVRLREAPAATAPVLGRLDYEIVQRSLDPPTAGWQRVETADRRQGFVALRYLRSPIDYRASFRREGNRWRLVLYIAGD